MFMDQWDYSKVPKLELKWFIEKEHWIDLIVEVADIRYIGKDVNIPFAVPDKDNANVTLFNGSVSKGSHKISMLLAFHVSNKVKVLKHTIEHEIQTQSGLYELTLKIIGNSTAGLTTDFSLKKRLN